MSQNESTETVEVEAKQGGTPNHIAIYQKIASRSQDIISCLFELMDSRNENIRLGAAKVLVNKIIPDLKQTQITGENGEPIKLNIISGADYLSALGISSTASTASTASGSSEVQGSDLAQTSQEDNNSNQSDSKVEPA